MHNQAHKSINTNLWENNSHLETLLKSKWGAEKECPIGPHDSFAPSPPLCSAPVSSYSRTSLPANSIKACCAGIPCLCFTGYQEDPISVISHTFLFLHPASQWSFISPTHGEVFLIWNHTRSSSRIKCKEKKSQKEKLQTKALLSPVTQTLSKSYMGVAQPTKTEPQHLPNRRLVSAHSTPHSAALLP